MPLEPFPRAALDANRSGKLTPDQAAFYRGEAASDRRTLLVAGVAVAGLGVVVLLGAITGRVPGNRIEALLGGAAFFAVGVAVVFLGGIRGARAKTVAAAAGRVTSVEGPIQRNRRDRRDGLFGEDTSHISPGNEYEYNLLVGDRRFTVGRPQWDAAPEDGVVRVYLLGDSDRIVNLERIADAPPPQVPALVRAALQRAAESTDPERAAEARAMLEQANVMANAAATSASAGARAIPPVDQPAAPGVPLERAILGSWRSALAGVTYEFRPDGSATASSTRFGAREQRWSLAGSDTLQLDESTLRAVVDGDVLSLGEPPQSLTFQRVG